MGTVQASPTNVSGIVFMCATQLHNFCINEQNDTVDLEAMQADVNVVSIMRDLLLKENISRDLVRPSHNI
jgi:hypothetical protein